MLIAPAQPDPHAFPAKLAEALGGGDVAAVHITGATGKQAEKLALALVKVAQNAGAAALIANDTRLAGHAGADGVQVDTGLGDLARTAEAFRPGRIVGAGGLASRHDAMQAGEIGVDYVFFGRPHADTHDAPHQKALELATWWSDLMKIPAVVMAGRSVESVGVAAATGAAFVAVHSAVWSHAGGPAEAVAQAEAALSSRRWAA
jgi:thiamine-phosphate pyrophosphorylase